MARDQLTSTPTSSMVAHLQEQGYYGLTTFETTHNANSREIRLYTNGTVTVLLHVHVNYDCDLYLPAQGTTMPLTNCPECHYPKTLFCDNPACPCDKSGKQLEGILAAEASWIAREEEKARRMRSIRLAHASTR